MRDYLVEDIIGYTVIGLCLVLIVGGTSLALASVVAILYRALGG